MCIEKLRKMWLDDVENDLKQIGVRGWRKMARDRNAWKLILKEARVLHGKTMEKREWVGKETDRVYLIS